MYTQCYILMGLFICIAKCGHACAASMLMVLIRIGPPRLHVYSRLTMSPSSEGGLFIDAITLFPWSLFGLAVPDLGTWPKVLSSHVRIFTITNIITSTIRQQ
jgi:hypothetical protein